MAKIERIDFVSGSSFQGEVTATYEELVEKFGEPNFGPDENSDGKVTCEWGVEIDGVICTIYDWKVYGDTPRGYYDWHIGGYNKKAYEKVAGVMNEKFIKKSK
jgi:hypothetical protein